jgi:hypothetical protein
MLLRLLGKVLAAVALMAAVWGLEAVPDSPLRPWIHPVGMPRGPVRILRFYATTGSIVQGAKAQLCYGVENAKWVRISPVVAPVFPTSNRCLEIVPDHTTHYTILAEGFDGNVVTRFLTLVVESAPAPPPERTNLAGWFLPSEQSSVSPGRQVEPSIPHLFLVAPPVPPARLDCLTAAS